MLSAFCSMLSAFRFLLCAFHFPLSPQLPNLRAETNRPAMKKLLFIIAALLPLLTYAQHKKTAPATFDLLIGTYTGGTSKGIYVYRFYAETGKTAYLNEIDDVSNPSYLCVADNNKFVYAVNENDKGGVSAFKFEAKTGKIDSINRQPSAGSSPCYISVDKDQKHLFVANYGSGSMAVLPVNKDGSIAAPSQVIQDSGSGPNIDRQAGPHVHTAVLAPNEKYLLYTDLGTDKINIYRYHSSKTEPLTPADPSFVSVTPGNGPRHIAFSADGKYVYLVQEMGGVVTGYNYDNGKLKEFQTISIVGKGFKGQIGAADIHISPDSAFLYVSNRGDANQITTFSINPDNGQLTYVGVAPSQGKTPRNFIIDPTGKYLLVANQNSDSVVIYRIDKKSGRLIGMVSRISIGNPVCLKLVPAE
jgi:6-phosphogluconolactonase